MQRGSPVDRAEAPVGPRADAVNGILETYRPDLEWYWCPWRAPTEVPMPKTLRLRHGRSCVAPVFPFVTASTPTDPLMHIVIRMSSCVSAQSLIVFYCAVPLVYKTDHAS